MFFRPSVSSSSFVPASFPSVFFFIKILPIVKDKSATSSLSLPRTLTSLIHKKYSFSSTFLTSSLLSFQRGICVSVVFFANKGFKYFSNHIIPKHFRKTVTKGSCEKNRCRCFTFFQEVNFFNGALNFWRDHVKVRVLRRAEDEVSI